jgi:hypothetical protein
VPARLSVSTTRAGGEHERSRTVARLLATPAGSLVILPVLVVAVGVASGQAFAVTALRAMRHNPTAGVGA